MGNNGDLRVASLKHHTNLLNLEHMMIKLLGLVVTHFSLL